MALISRGGSPVMRLSIWLLMHLINSATAELCTQVTSIFSCIKKNIASQLNGPLAIDCWKLKHCTTYFDNATKLGITDGQLLVGLFGDHLLEDFLQALANFALNKGGSS